MYKITDFAIPQTWQDEVIEDPIGGSGIQVYL